MVKRLSGRSDLQMAKPLSPTPPKALAQLLPTMFLPMGVSSATLRDLEGLIKVQPKEKDEEREEKE